MIAQFNLTPELIYVIEALKVEGWWSVKSRALSIQNKNLPFLKRIELIIKSLGLNVYKRVLLKIKIDDDINKKDIDFISKNKRLSFHLERSPFDGSIRIVTSLPYKRKYNLVLKVAGKSLNIKVLEGKEEIKVKGAKGWAYLDLRFPIKRFLTFLEEYTGGRKKLRIEPFLFKSSKKFVASAFSALIDAEGNLAYYGFFRKLSIRMRDFNYLKNWTALLSKFGINCSLSSNEIETRLTIEGWEDFNNLNNLGLMLYHSKKAEMWDKILGSYKRKQVSRSTARQFYTNKLKEINKYVTAEELSNMLEKSKRVVSHYLTILDREKRINVDKSKMPYLYKYKL